MAGKLQVIPEVYFLDVEETHQVADQEVHTSDTEGELEQEVGPTEGKTVDLTKEGFIPIYKLTLDDLPEDIRTEENFQHIQDMAKRVVVVNNNRLSDKRFGDEQMRKSGSKSLRGSGVLVTLESGRAFILTNRHVLFNNEELERSTFDVFYDYDHGDPDNKEKLFKRCRRGDGEGCARMYSRYDVTDALYHVKDEMLSHIGEHCLGNNKPLCHCHLTQVSLENHGAKIVPTVCLISHPLGKPKHVSFGQMADINFHTGMLHHTAPSKPGSSGAPLIIFSDKSSFDMVPTFIYHVGTNRKTGLKEAQFDFPKNHLIYDHDAVFTDECNLSTEELAEPASLSLENEFLAALVPIFGAFLLHMDKGGLGGIDTALLKPCNTWKDVDSLLSTALDSDVEDFIQKIEHNVPGFNLDSSFSAGKEPDLASLLVPQGPCFCQSIVKLMERGVKSGDSTLTESFLSPDTAAAKMSTDSDVTWPWLNRRESDLSSQRMEEEECLTKKCLQSCNKSPYAIDAPIILLLMMTKANMLVEEALSHSHDVSTRQEKEVEEEEETHMETIYSRTDQALPPEMTSEELSGDTGTSPHLVEEEDAKPSQISVQEDCSGLAKGILTLVVVLLRPRMLPFISSAWKDKHDMLSKQEQGDKDLDVLFSRSLAWLEHSMEHLQGIHPDTEPAVEEDGSRDLCRCGRPSFPDVFWPLIFQKLSLMPGEVDHLGAILEMLHELDFQELTPAFFNKLQEEALEKQPDNPGNFILTFLDNCGHFCDGRHSVIHSQASSEALLYNCRQLVRQINKTYQTDYFALPVSVYGRPGNWPGNVTPPEVQRKAWRLIQDAIMESGFPPAVLADLEDDEERRQRLIDVYVDMKQLKWQGRIQPHLLGKWAASPKTTQARFALSELYSFPDATSYIAWSVSVLVCPQIIFL